MKNSALSYRNELSGFTKVCETSDLSEHQGNRFIIHNTEIAVFKVDGNIYSLSNICPHQHSALIYDGFIEKGCVVCPAHGWMFDLQTGKTQTGGRGIDSFETKVIDNQVYVKIIQQEMKW
jgi:nitrite reductase/ring-hydroxylating ferredoxin subunit